MASRSSFWQRVRPGDRRGRRLAVVSAGLAALLLATAVWVLWPYVHALGRIGDDPAATPSRLYARPEALWIGKPDPPSRVVAELATAGYRETGSADLAPGRYRRTGDRVTVRLHHRLTATGAAPPELLEISFAHGAIARLRRDGRTVGRAELEAPLLASFYGAEVREVWPVEVAELPEHVVDAVLAAEDAGFYRHLGVSPSGTLRAALVNLRSGAATQGGSTLTQQLVKNVFLTAQRTLARKLREAALAVVVDATHSKPEILQAYLNRIYLGTGHGVNYHGLGAAARAYFGKDPRELSVGEAALLAGMIRSPAHLEPLGHPQAARQRRDEVLRRMHDLGWLDADRLGRALAEPVATNPTALGTRRAPHFAVAAAREAESRFGIHRLGDTGYRLFATLSSSEQAVAQRAVTETTKKLGRGEPLEGALIALDPRTGAVLAWVGGRDFSHSQFDRVFQARRQPGSAFKPVVLAAAFERAGASAATRLDDSPLHLDTGGRTWSPQNHDRRFRGPVTARTAVEESLNVPMVRLALATGLPEIADTAARLGIDGEVPEMPSSALGAFAVSPFELARVYATLAGEGRRPTVHGLRSVFDAHGRRVEDRHPPHSEPVLDPKIAYLVTSVLEGVVARGTGRAARRDVGDGPLAAKTGTSNDARDCWFAAYTPERVTVVWVGHDDFSPTPYSGATAALPVWGVFAAGAAPARRGAAFREPPGLVHQPVCTASGRLPTRWCPTVREEIFLPDRVPSESCDLHHAPAPRERHRPPGKGVGRWLRDLWGSITG